MAKQPSKKTTARLARERNVRRRAPNPKHEDNYPRVEKKGQGRVCPECGLVLRAGRWQRAARPSAGVADELCPACQRIRQGYPAGTLRVPAAFAARREELLGLIRNEEKVEAPEHPLERLMGIVEEDGGLVVTTTGVHLARRIANKIERRFHRQARFEYSDGDGVVHVHWETE